MNGWRVSRHSRALAISASAASAGVPIYWRSSVAVMSAGLLKGISAGIDPAHSLDPRLFAVGLHRRPREFIDPAQCLHHLVVAVDGADDQCGVGFTLADFSLGCMLPVGPYDPLQMTLTAADDLAHGEHVPRQRRVPALGHLILPSTPSRPTPRSPAPPRTQPCTRPRAPTRRLPRTGRGSWSSFPREVGIGFLDAGHLRVRLGDVGQAHRTDVIKRDRQPIYAVKFHELGKLVRPVAPPFQKIDNALELCCRYSNVRKSNRMDESGHEPSSRGRDVDLGNLHAVPLLAGRHPGRRRPKLHTPRVFAICKSTHCVECNISNSERITHRNHISLREMCPICGGMDP